MVNMYQNNHFSSLTFPSVACVNNCDTCDAALNTCTNCADGFDDEPVCTSKERLSTF